MKYIFVLILLIIEKNAFCQMVYKTPYGEKYHLSTCRMVENISKELSIAEAIQQRLTPCKICKPPLEENNLKLKPNTPRGESNSVQCMGITKREHDASI